MAKRKGFWERYAHKKLSVTKREQDIHDQYILTDEEHATLKKIRNRTYLKAALAGITGVILLYVPYHLWPNLFPVRNIWIPIYNDYLELEIEFMVYGFLLVLLEIWFLTYINIAAVVDIAETCGSPRRQDSNYEDILGALVNVSVEKKQKELQALGINPYEGLSPIGVFAFQMLIRLKATISGVLWKLLVRRLLGRYAIRLLVDLLGGPVYALWNIICARKVMN